MPTDPLVCAILLTRDRPAMARRAVECFRAQTYQAKHLLVLDTGKESPFGWITRDNSGSLDCGSIGGCHRPELCGLSVGALRNWVNGLSISGILFHFDDDDISHPNRIAEQVALLQSSGADCVGYNEVLFWREELHEPSRIVSCHCGERYPRSGAPCPNCHTYPDGEAWLYSNRSPAYAVGASLCYWRRTWERHPFPDMQVGEDRTFLQSIRNAGGGVVGVTSIPAAEPGWEKAPRLIQSIHGANTSAAVDPKSDNWRRVPEWDAYARERFAL